MTGVYHNFAPSGGPMVKAPQTGCTTMEAFDQLGPLTREAVNYANALWSTNGLLVHKRNGVLDAAMAWTVKDNDERWRQRAVADREGRRGIWAPGAPFKPAPDGYLMPHQPPPKRGTAAWRAAALARATQRST
jgi:hypothetical protein